MAIGVITAGCTRVVIPLEQCSLQPKLGAVSEALMDSLVRIGDVAVDDGAMVLTDVGTHRVVQRNAKGHGRQGQGPMGAIRQTAGANLGGKRAGGSSRCDGGRANGRHFRSGSCGVVAV